MDPLIKDYLRNHTFQQLEDEHGVCVRWNATSDKLSVNYYQFMTKSGDKLAEQCRGMVIRPTQFVKSHFGDDDGWKHAIVGDIDVLAWPMNRFYNHGDGAAVEIDWSDPNIRVYEKVDGTCIILYWDPLHCRWHAGTRSVPEADLPIYAGHMEIGDTTFSQLFLKALVSTREELSGQPVGWHVDGPDKVVHLNKELTYVFELVSPYNQIVVVYPHPRVYFLAARHTASGKEIAIETLRLEHVRRPKTWPIRDVVTLSAFVDSASPSELEGAVVCDSRFGRLKVKNKTYVLAHKSKDSVTSSLRNALEAVVLEKVDDIVPLVPADVGERLLKMQAAYAGFCHIIDTNVTAFKLEAAGSRKRFAELVMLSGDWSAPYFSLWEGRAPSAREWVKAQCEKGKLSAGSLDTILAKLGV